VRFDKLVYSPFMLKEAISGAEIVAKAWSFALADSMAGRIATYFVELLRWNEKINLTGARSIQELVDEHLDDCFALSRLVPAQSSVVDVGSGGGLPAVPFAILRPDCKVCMVEPRAKRVAFLRSLTRTIKDTSLEVCHGRWDELGSRSFAVAVSRATFAPKEWLGIGARIVEPQGLVVALAAAQDGLASSSARLVQSVEYASRNGTPRWAGAFCFT